MIGTVRQLFHSMRIHDISALMAQGVYSDINVSPFKTQSVKGSWRGDSTSLLFGPKCFFSLQDKLLLLFDHFQTLDRAPCDCCLDPTHLLRVTLLRGLFFPFVPQPRRRSENGAAGRSRGGALCRHFTTVIRSALPHCSSQSSTQSPSQGLVHVANLACFL